MTSYPPPGPPPGPPPPPPGSYETPSSGRSAKFDPKSVNRLDWGILAAGVLALIFSFFNYYSYSVNRGKVADALNLPRSAIDAVCSNPSQVPAAERSDADAFCNGVTTGAWHGFFGWFGVLLALLGAIAIAVAIFTPQVKLGGTARLAALATFALGVIFTLIALPVVPNYKGANTSSLGGTGVTYDDVVNESHSFSYWIVLILILAGLVLTFLRFQQTGGQLPIGRGSSAGSGAGGSGQHGYGPPPGYAAPPGGPPQSGYAAPPPGGPPQSGYGSPPPQPGYGTPPAQPGYSPPPPSPGYQPPPPPPQ